MELPLDMDLPDNYHDSLLYSVQGLVNHIGLLRGFLQHCSAAWLFHDVVCHSLR